MRRPPHVALAAWIVTGPVGHLYAGAVDWAIALVRWRASVRRARRRR